MAFKSFRKDAALPPPHYRTPSPPAFAFEPISPTTFEETGNDFCGIRWIDSDNSIARNGTKEHPLDVIRSQRCKESQGPPSSMDAFASIALATKLNPPRLCDTFRITEDQSIERPSKRARSEKLPSPEWHRTGMRPATSYDQSSDSRTFEAELLLNFSQAARFSSPRTTTHQVSYPPPILEHNIEQDGSPSSDPYVSDSAGQPHYHAASSGDSVEEALLSAINEMQDPATETFSNAHAATAQNTVPQRTQSKAASTNTSLPRDTQLMKPQLVVEDGAFDGNLQTELLEDLQSSGQPSCFQTVDAHGPGDAPGEMRELELLKSLPTGAADGARPIEQNTETLLEKVAQEGLLRDGHGQVLGDTSETGDGTKAFRMDITPVRCSVSVDDLGLSLPRPGGATGLVEQQPRQMLEPAVCAACHFTRNTLIIENGSDSTSWINCDGCKSWFHFACAGFKNEREVRGVDKYRCKKCKPVHGATSYVRKSSRAHSDIDYAGLNEGVIKTSDESPEHHYIQPIKDGTIKFQPETFPRMRAEMVTAEYFERSNGMKEPIVIPANFNPRPKPSVLVDAASQIDVDVPMESSQSFEQGVPDEWFSIDSEVQRVPDHGQDALDMVVPQDLTIRKVAELYGPEEKVEVIDVKSQNGENKKWNMRRWADYYESDGNKVVRNVISLEVSQSKLGRLIRRPQVVRDLDLQDAVWPPELQAKGEYPKVQFYCLMSVADCFTDFHIDFGGSSVFYHILKGKKTFLFIPPKEKHLKKYEEWCMSPAQNWTFLADQTKECYRVDLTEGDTMLIPAGWIHAVWTPEDSLVIGGNFLTRMHYGMQIRIAQIEKATGVARKFRYPYFQKLLWYAAIRYLEEDPLPESVQQSFQDDGSFYREQPAYYDFDEWGENSRSGLENYHLRYYSQAELEGLPDLVRYLLRTALIDVGSITEGITAETRNAVRRSIPRGHGEALEIVKSFAMWCAWKRGNEPIPQWAHSDAVPETSEQLSAASIKKMNREAALQAPRRQSARRQSQQQVPISQATTAAIEDAILSSKTPLSGEDNAEAVTFLDPVTPVGELTTPAKRESFDAGIQTQHDTSLSSTVKKPRMTTGSGRVSHRKPACESCRKRRRACKHREHPEILTMKSKSHGPEGILLNVSTSVTKSHNAPGIEAQSAEILDQHLRHTDNIGISNRDHTVLLTSSGNELSPPQQIGPLHSISENLGRVENRAPPLHGNNQPDLNSSDVIPLLAPETATRGTIPKGSDIVSEGLVPIRGRSKACNECRKSKRRCIHDEYGNEDPVKLREAAISRPTASIKRRKASNEGQDSSAAKKSKKPTKPLDPPRDLTEATRYTLPTVQIPKLAPTAVMIDQSSETERQKLHSSEMRSPDDNVDLAQQALLQDNSPHSHTRVAHIEQESPTTSKLIAEQRSIRLVPGQQDNVTEPTPTLDTQIQLIQSPPTHDLKISPSFEPMHHPPDDSFSLVSPPASLHNDPASTSPLSNANANANANPTPSASSSRHSSHRPKQSHHYTPESGSARRASSSSAGLPVLEKSPSPLTNFSTAEGGSALKRVRVRNPEEVLADEESLRLIKELQAQEYGLRRRGRH